MWPHFTIKYSSGSAGARAVSCRSEGCRLMVVLCSADGARHDMWSLCGHRATTTTARCRHAGRMGSSSLSCCTHDIYPSIYRVGRRAAASWLRRNVASVRWISRDLLPPPRVRWSQPIVLVNQMLFHLPVRWLHLEPSGKTIKTLRSSGSPSARPFMHKKREASI